MSQELDRFRQPQERGLSSIFNRSSVQKDTAKQMEQVTRDVRVAAHKIDGAASIAGRAMERAIQLDVQRRALADGDETWNSILIEIEVGFVRQVQGIQRDLYRGWGI